jgi:thiol-disulfide isomerase/thioredoxin
MIDLYNDPPLPRWSRFSLISLATLISGAIIGLSPAQAEPAKLDLSAYKGKVVYLDFWASWCGPCKASFPYMERLKSAYGGDGLVIIAVNVDHSQAKAANFLSAQGSDLTVVYDPKGEIATAYHVKDMPTSVLIDRDGKVRYVHKGFFPDQTAEYGRQVEVLLHEK